MPGNFPYPPAGEWRGERKRKVTGNGCVIRQETWFLESIPLVIEDSCGSLVNSLALQPTLFSGRAGFTGLGNQSQVKGIWKSGPGATVTGHSPQVIAVPSFLFP